MSEKLVIEKLGPIKRLEIEPRPLTVLIGEQASGKSLAAQIMYFFRGLKSHLGRIYSGDWASEQSWQAEAIREILDNLRGVPFGYFADGTASLHYINGDIDADWKISVYASNRKVRPRRKLALKMDLWLKEWEADPESLGKARIIEQVFIPTERSLFTRLSEDEESVLYAEYQPEPFRRFATVLRRALGLYPRLDSLVEKASEASKKNAPEFRHRQRLLAYQEKALEGQAYVPSRGPKQWKWRIEQGNTTKILPIKIAASGQMEAWPFFALAATFGSFRFRQVAPELDFYFEEPETHLHPRAQWQVMKAIVYLIVNRGHRFVITTHSPYILYALNNMIQRYISYNGNPPEGEPAIDPEMVGAWRLGNLATGVLGDIMDRTDTSLVDVEELEQVANEMGREFDELLFKSEEPQ